MLCEVYALLPCPQTVSLLVELGAHELETHTVPVNLQVVDIEHTSSPGSWVESDSARHHAAAPQRNRRIEVAIHGSEFASWAPFQLLPFDGAVCPACQILTGLRQARGATCKVQGCRDPHRSAPR